MNNMRICFCMSSLCGLCQYKHTKHSKVLKENPKTTSKLYLCKYIYIYLYIFSIINYILRFYFMVRLGNPIWYYWIIQPSYRKWIGYTQNRLIFYRNGKTVLRLFNSTLRSLSICILLSMLIILILVEAELPKKTLILSPPISFHNKTSLWR